MLDLLMDGIDARVRSGVRLLPLRPSLSMSTNLPRFIKLKYAAPFDFMLIVPVQSAM
jgi:hypothetical protein